MSHSCTACCGHVGPGKHCYKCGLQGPPIEAQQTHHPTCYREHHACAVARLDRLREKVDDVSQRLWRDAPGSVAESVLRGELAQVLVAVRDITEGRC